MLLKRIAQLFAHAYDVLLRVRTVGTEQPVSDPAVVREDNEAVGIAIEPTDREDALAELAPDFVLDIFLACFCRMGDDALRLMVRVIDVCGRSRAAHRN